MGVTNLHRPALRLLGELDEILQQLQADVLAFFGMKLGRENVFAPDGGGEGFAVSGAGSHNGGLSRLGKKAVNEIDVAPRRNSAKERAIGTNHIELVPTDLRDLEAALARESNHFAGKDPQAGSATVELFALLEQGLVPHTDAQKRSPRADEVARRFEQSLVLQGVHAIIERAHTGKHGRARAGHVTRLAGDAHLRAHFEQRFVDATQIAGPVIHQSDHADTLSGGLRTGNTEAEAD